jgi:4-amino-4-deoxy-L-arabinose transferase-like glycosyltransferase
MTSEPDPNRRRFLLRLLAFCALGLLLRLAAVALVPTQQTTDFWSYYQRAVNLLDVGVYGVRPGTPNATWPPGYPLALALALKVCGRSLLTAKILNALLGAATVGLAGLLGRRLAGDGVGLATAGIAAVYPRLVLTPCICASENLFLPLLLLWFLLLAATWSRERDLRGALLSGVVLGLATLVRSVGYPLSLLWPLSGAATRRKPWAGLAAETLLLLLAQHAVLLPWALRNKETLGHFSFFTDAVGATLFMGNNPHATGHWYLATADVERALAGQPIADPFERDAALRRAALRWIAEDPAAAFRLFLVKLASAFTHEGILEPVATATWTVPRHSLPRGVAPFPVQALPDDHFFRKNAPALRWAFALPYALLLLLEAGGLLLVARGRLVDPGLRLPILLAFGGAALYFALFGALLHGDPRLRWPATDLLLAFAGLALVALRRRAPSSSKPASG